MRARTCCAAPSPRVSARRSLAFLSPCCSYRYLWQALTLYREAPDAVICRCIRVIPRMTTLSPSSSSPRSMRDRTRLSTCGRMRVRTANVSGDAEGSCSPALGDRSEMAVLGGSSGDRRCRYHPRVGLCTLQHVRPVVASMMLSTISLFSVSVRSRKYAGRGGCLLDEAHG